MRKSRKKVGSLVKQVEDCLMEMMSPGESKYEDKLNDMTGEKIYSYGTLKSYMDLSCRFVKWCKAKYPKCRVLSDCKPYIEEYINSLTRYKNSSKKTVRSALNKLYLEDCGVKIGPRLRADIVRSRKETVGDKHFSEENNADLIEFCRGTGLRNYKELQVITGNMLKKREDGYWLMGVKGKNGLFRNVRVFPGFEETVVRLCKEAGDGKVWTHVHSNADVHSYRADYAQLWYREFARPIEDIPRKERYYCRKDKRGTVYDRKALLTVSRYLGHNRIDVMVQHYLWKDDDEMSKICPRTFRKDV